MREIETKILEIDKEDVKKTLVNLGAKKISEEKLVVDWYGPKGLTHDGDDSWFLRVRTYDSTQKYEVTWKAKSEHIGVSRRHKEINFNVSHSEAIGDLFEELDLEKYAHQEKKRESWELNDIRFDIDTYPKMPTFLEIEAKSTEDIEDMIKKLNLEKNQTWNDGERTLIKQKYCLNWFDMCF
jgi:adenylate cyclase class 2